MTIKLSREEISGYECKNAVYVQAQDGSGDDAVIVKEWIHTKDGRQIPNLRIYENYSIPFYVTLEAHQNHEEKKEWEPLSKLRKFVSTQARLPQNVARALGRGKIQGGLRIAARSPYLYGTDMTAPVLIKQRYRDRYPDAKSNNRVAVFDIETDVVNGTELPILLTISFKDRVFVAVTEAFVGTTVDYPAQLQAGFEKYLGEYKKDRNITLEVMVVATPGQGVVECFKRAHAWEPDFVSMWNMDFDIPKCLDVLKREGIDPADVFSDPRVPKRFRYFNYRQSKPTKETASGKITPVPPAERWHVADCPAGFYLICSMCAYRRIRIAKQLERYGLDAVLGKVLKLGKLKFEAANHVTKLAWHHLMQSRYKVEYGVYNIFDCIGVELLDEKTKDLAQVISIQCKASQFATYKSQPRRLVDDIYFFCRDRKLVPAACSDQMETELDKLTVSMNDWIVTLPSHLVVENGLCVLAELPNVRSHIRVHVADLDIVSTYPNVQTILNISKETTVRELCEIDGLDELTKRMAGVNLTGGHTNAWEIACEVMGAPSPSQVLEAYRKRKGQKLVP